MQGSSVSHRRALIGIPLPSTSRGARSNWAGDVAAHHLGISVPRQRKGAQSKSRFGCAASPSDDGAYVEAGPS